MDNALNPYSVIVRPLVTEKSTALSVANQYVFEVDMRSNKPQIKDAVEKAFEVTVLGVNVMVMKGKRRGNRRMGRRETFSSDWKKAVVTVAPEDRIELFEGI